MPQLASNEHPSRRADPNLGRLPDRAYLGLLQGVRALVCDGLEADPKAKLTEFAADVRTWLTAASTGARVAAG